jgi:tetratricopeptide (TPR) repeat protein
MRLKMVRQLRSIFLAEVYMRIRALPLCILALLYCGCSRSPAAKEAKFLARGKKFLDQKDYARAALEFRSANQANPRDAEPWYQLGIAYLGAKQPDNAFLALLKATELNPRHTSAQLRVSEMALQSQQPEVLQEAVKRLNQVLTDDQPEVLDALAIADFKLKKPEEAIDLLHRALAKFPNDIRSAGTLAAIQFGQHDFEGAEQTLSTTVARAPQSADAAMALANLYLLENKKQEAEPELQRAIRIAPSNTPALLTLGALQLQAGRTSEADETYRRIAALPGANLSYIHAAFLFQQGKKAEAVEELEKLAKGPGADRAARLRLVGAYIAMNRTEEALEYLEGLLKSNPKDADALLLRARVYLTKGQSTEARKDFEGVLRIHPNSADAHYGLSRVQAMMGFEQNRQRELTEALRLNPALFQARVELARSQVGSGQAQAALDTMDAAPRNQKSGIVFNTTRNWALLALNRVDEADAEAEKQLHIYPGGQATSELALQRATARFMKKDYAGARAGAQQILRADPEDVPALNLVMESCVAEKQTPLALQILKEAASRNANSARMQLLIGQWLGRFGKLTEARAALSAAKNLNPASTDSDLAIAMLDMQEGKIETARTELTNLLAAQPANEAANLLLAELEFSQKNSGAAAVHFVAAVEKNPDNVTALNGAAYLMVGQDPNVALKYAQHAADLAPNNAMVQDTLGWVYYRRGDYPKAVEYLSRSVAGQPSPVRRFHLAMAYLKAGDRDQGQQQLSQALAQDPNLLKNEEGWLP